MKKAIALCLTAAMAASLLTGCGGKTTETTAAAENKTETTAGEAAAEKKDEAAGVVKVIEYDLTDEQYAFGVDKDQPELLEQVNTFIAKIKEDGTLDEIFDKYFGSGEPEAVKSAALDTSKDQLVVATNAAFEPFEYTQGEDYYGIDMEIAALLAEELGQELVIQNMDFDAVCLSVGQQQMVEIAKALMVNAKVIIMDEPTAALTQSETRVLFEAANALRERGVSIVYISHRMEEIFELCDRITILRDGTYIDTKKISETDMNDVVKMMIGREIGERYPQRNVSIGNRVLEVKNLTCPGVFEKVSFEVHAGEVLGVSGLMGAGRTEIMQAIFGNMPHVTGEIFSEWKTDREQNAETGNEKRNRIYHRRPESRRADAGREHYEKYFSRKSEAYFQTRG